MRPMCLITVNVVNIPIFHRVLLHKARRASEGPIDRTELLVTTQTTLIVTLLSVYYSHHMTK